jgi:hypothetical protein
MGCTDTTLGRIVEISWKFVKVVGVFQDLLDQFTIVVQNFAVISLESEFYAVRCRLANGKEISGDAWNVRHRRNIDDSMV